MSYGWRIELDGVDITKRISSFEISADLDSFVRELSLDVADQGLYDSIDFYTVPSRPQIEVFVQTQIDWISQGRFYVEKPTYEVALKKTTTGVWGRSTLAALDSPFAEKINKTWCSDTSFFEICDEVCWGAGVAWDSQYSNISDYFIYAYTYQADSKYPIEILTELAGFVGAVVTTDRFGHVCIRNIQYAPLVSDFEIEDQLIAKLAEAPEWPEYGNQITIIPSAETYQPNSVEILIDKECACGPGACKVVNCYARVTDGEGNPVNGYMVNWSVSSPALVLSGSVSSTAEVQMIEVLNAKATNAVTLGFVPDTVLGIWMYADKARTINHVDWGCKIDGKDVLVSEGWEFCDQKIRVAYICSGVATIQAWCA